MNTLKQIHAGNCSVGRLLNSFDLKGVIIERYNESELMLTSESATEGNNGYDTHSIYAPTVELLIEQARSIRMSQVVVQLYYPNPYEQDE